MIIHDFSYWSEEPNYFLINHFTPSATIEAIGSLGSIYFS